MTWPRSRRVGGWGATDRRRAGVVLALALVLPASGCSLFQPTSVTSPSPTPDAPLPPDAGSVSSMAPTPGATGSTPSTAPSNVATLGGGNGLALGLVLPAGALPSGWSETSPRDTGGYRMSVCGVDLEPSSPVDGAQKRWQRSSNGPFLEQHVRVYSDRTATDVVAALKKAVPGCRTYTARDERGGSSTYTVERLALQGVGNETVAWRQRVGVPVATPTSTASPSGPARVPTPTPSRTASPSGTASPSAPARQRAPQVVQDVALTRRGSSVVLFSAYAVDGNPPSDVLQTAIRATPGN